MAPRSPGVCIWMSTPHHALTPPASAQPIGSRLEALALRHSIGGLLRSGCSSPPEVVEHEEFAANNFAFPVPGLQELAAMHTRWANSASGGVSTSRWTQGKLRLDASEILRSHSSQDPQCRIIPPACAGACAAHAVRCDWNASVASWKRAMRIGTTRASAIERGLHVTPSAYHWYI